MFSNQTQPLPSYAIAVALTGADNPAGNSASVVAASHQNQLAAAGLALAMPQPFEQQQPQQLTCMNVVSADDRSNQLATAGHVIFNQSGLIRIGEHAGVLNVSPSQAAIGVNTLAGELRQQQQQPPPPPPQASHHNTIPAFAPCASNGGGNSIAALTHCSHHEQLHVAPHSHPDSKAAGESCAKKSADASSLATAPMTMGAGKSSSSAGVNSSNLSSSREHSSSGGGSFDGRRVCARERPRKGAESPRQMFACPTCAKEFTEKFNMKRHMQVHSQSRPKFVCTECSKSFVWKDNFVRHKKVAHKNAAVSLDSAA